MRITSTILAACLCVAFVNSLPMPNEGFKSQALDRLMVVEADNESALRSKRTIGLLRQLFPDVSKMIEDKVNSILGEIFKIFGPVVFQSILGNRNGGGGLFGGGGGGGNGASDSKSSTGSTVNVKNPFEDDDDFKSFVDDDDFFSKPKEGKESDSGSRISVQLPTEKSEDESKSTTPATTTTTVSTTTTTSEKNEVTNVSVTTEKIEETTLSNIADNVTANNIVRAD